MCLKSLYDFVCAQVENRCVYINKYIHIKKKIDLSLLYRKGERQTKQKKNSYEQKPQQKNLMCKLL